MPKDLPHNIKVDVSVLINFGDQILAEDIILPKGVTLLANPKEVVATISAPREEKEEEVAPADLSTIEVEKKGKEEEKKEETEKVSDTQ
ncbi:MAG: 50S ribosomal protein L25 [Candidatus Azambacteria bacterium GW2011_GWF2_42_22]|nr:MAG: 50S ribosomal protein L25 [Candidatus Azambacteria bacterium GW2011_GWF2_42_22]